ncbi:MAG: tetratricopeptide repeat protein, partial [Nitrospinae bacterium]|nr:tetratricopeptide repeat protein [Nitrospinota bacterium]
VYQMQEKWDDSNQQFQAFLNVKGPMPSVYTHIGFNYSRLMDWEKARSFLEKSISLQPGNADARIYLAEVFTNLGEKEKALEQLETVSNPSPDQFTVINNMMLSLKNDSP